MKAQNLIIALNKLGAEDKYVDLIVKVDDAVVETPVLGGLTKVDGKLQLEILSSQPEAPKVEAPEPEPEKKEEEEPETPVITADEAKAAVVETEAESAPDSEVPEMEKVQEEAPKEEPKEEKEEAPKSTKKSTTKKK